MVKRILEWKQKGSRQTGRPRIRWLDDVMMNVKNWKELALNRRLAMTWLRKPKPTNGCKANGRRSIQLGAALIIIK
jgi:hypothetical protein